MGFWTIYLLALLASVNLVTAADVITAFQENDINSDVIEVEDNIKFLKVTYGDSEVNLGNELTPTQVMEMPCVTWECDSNEYFTLIYTDPDVPSPENRTLGEFIHWMEGNILGNNVSGGETIVEYVGSAPPLGSGLHRYIFFLFKQPYKLTFDEPRLGVNGTGMERTMFSTRKFAEKYNLGPPKAGNFYFAQYDESVNATLTLLGF